MTKSLGINFEKAVRLLSKYLPVSEEDGRKPIFFHDIRVGVYLYENGYSEVIVLAGVLHDAIEWSNITEELLKKEFGSDVFHLVLASTKDISIENKDERIKELIQRCVNSGQNALIVKAADIIDSFKWYSSQNNEDQLINHCIKNSKLILTYKPDKFDDKIFDELNMWQERILNVNKF